MSRDYTNNVSRWRKEINTATGLGRKIGREFEDALKFRVKHETLAKGYGREFYNPWPTAKNIWWSTFVNRFGEFLMT